MIEQDYPSGNLDDMETDFLESHSALDEDSREEELDEQWDAQPSEEEGEFISSLRDCPSVEAPGGRASDRRASSNPASRFQGNVLGFTCAYSRALP